MRAAASAASLLVPIGSDYYYQRGRISPSPNRARPARWICRLGLHPALRDTIYPAVHGGEATFVPFAGTEDLSRSHFETQDSIELGQALDRRRLPLRLPQPPGATLNAAPAAIAFTDQLPLIMQGSLQVPNTALRTSPSRHSTRARPDDRRHVPGHAPGAAGARRLRRARGRDEGNGGEMDAANRNAITAKGFELEARRIAR
jgi:hypothetical protein